MMKKKTGCIANRMRRRRRRRRGKGQGVVHGIEINLSDAIPAILSF